MKREKKRRLKYSVLAAALAFSLALGLVGMTGGRIYAQDITLDENAETLDEADDVLEVLNAEDTDVADVDEEVANIEDETSEEPEDIEEEFEEEIFLGTLKEASSDVTDQEIFAMLAETTAYVESTTKATYDPTDPNQAWNIISLARGTGFLGSKSKAANDFKEQYYESVKEAVIQGNGSLGSVAENAKVTIALTVLGYDVRYMGVYDLFENFNTASEATSSGSISAAYCIIALYSNPAYADAIPRTEVDAIMDYIKNCQQSDGGFSYSLDYPGSDVDMTAMVLPAVVLYGDGMNVVIDKALDYLSQQQLPEGGFSSYGTESSESISQVILTLCEMGVNPQVNPRFNKNGNTLFTALREFYVGGGQFRHDMTDNGDPMATRQALNALSSYFRMVGEETGGIFYNEEKLYANAETNDVIDLPAELLNKLPIPAITGTVWRESSGKGFALRFNADVSDFVEVRVDNETIGDANYYITEGSTIITFTPAYLSMLSAGKHSVKLISRNGFAEAEVEIVKDSAPVSPPTDNGSGYVVLSPKTGE